MVYEHAINPDQLRTRIAEGETRLGACNRRVIVDKREHLLSDTLQPWRWQDVEGGQETWTRWSQDLPDTLTTASIAHRIESDEVPSDEAHGAARFAAVKRWFEDDWMRIEPKLRTSIVEDVSVFLSLFDDHPEVKHTFCPLKETYERTGSTAEEHGTPLQPMADLIEQGR